MPRIVLNGKSLDAAAGMTVLECARAEGITIPALCHDPRVKPYGGCRLCVVEIEGEARPVTSCNTVVREGMAVRTHTPELEKLRQSLLRMLANDYPAEAVELHPAKPFHRLLGAYSVRPGGNGDQHRESADGSHPYIHVNPAQCILCNRCVRVCEEVQGQFVWKVWNRGDRSRILPDCRADAEGTDSTGTLLESSCVSCGTCVDACPTGALEDRSLIHAGSPGLDWTRTTCPYCGTGCEVHVGTRDGQIVACKPVLDAPVSKGHLCSKGRYAFGFVHAPDRVLSPMLRTNGSWRTVSWDEAIAAAVTLMRRTVERYGPDSAAVLGSARGTNEENYLAQKFARLVLGTNNVDCCARVCHGPTAEAMKQTLGTGAATNSFDDIEQAQTILVCGANPTEAHPVVGARVKQAALRGARLIVIDPRKIELCDYAEVHLQIRPGTNVALLNAMAACIIEEHLADVPFIRDRIQDYDVYERFLRGSSPESAAATCGVEAGAIRKAARIYASSKPSLSIHGLGMTEHVQGTDGVACLVNLALLTGNVGKPGAGVNPLRGQNNVQGAAHMGCDPGVLTGGVGIEAGASRFRSVHGQEVPRQKGLNLMEMIAAAGAGDLKLLWVIGYDILHSNANVSATRAALKNLDGVIVQDLFLTETAREFGTIFLPACSSYEKDGTFMNAERRIQRVRRALAPRGESKSDGEIIGAMACAMGAERQFDFASPEAIWDEVRQVWPAGAGITYPRLESGGLQWPCPDEQHPGTGILHAETFPGGKRARLACVKFSPSPELPCAEYSFLLTTGRSLQQFNAGTMTQRTEHKRLRGADLLDISPADAQHLGIKEGELVTVRSRYGEAALPAHITDSVAEGALFATFHDRRSLVNQITGSLADQQTLTPQYKVTAVKIAGKCMDPSLPTPARAKAARTGDPGRSG